MVYILYGVQYTIQTKQTILKTYNIPTNSKEIEYLIQKETSFVSSFACILRFRFFKHCITVNKYSLRTNCLTTPFAGNLFFYLFQEV